MSSESPFQDILDMIAFMKEQQSNGVPFDMSQHKLLEQLTETPRWEPFYGYNHVKIPNFEIRWGGGISFVRHIGKPLSAGLWKDLTMRMCVAQLCIFRNNDAVPCVSQDYGGCYVHLNAEDNVRDIYFTPHWRK